MSKSATTPIDAPMPAAAPVERCFELVEDVVGIEGVVDTVFVGVLVPVGVLVADGV